MFNTNEDITRNKCETLENSLENAYDGVYFRTVASL